MYRQEHRETQADHQEGESGGCVYQNKGVAEIGGITVDTNHCQKYSKENNREYG